jgi:UDP-N-acetylglucosamine 2-epimerase (hydrolysing)
MLSDSLPSLDEAKKYYEIPFDDYALAILHPVTTELGDIRKQTETFVDALQESGLRYIVIYPNNDVGCETIFSAYERLKNHPFFKLFPSLRFEYFLAL